MLFDANNRCRESGTLRRNGYGNSRCRSKLGRRRISADQGDTIVTVNDKVLRDGYHETVLKTVPTKQVKRVYGYILMNNADSSYYKVYLDSLNLMKYNYGRLTDMAKDSSAVKISTAE